MNDPTNARKLEHIRILEADPHVDRQGHHFDAIRLRHRALPELNLADVDPSTSFLGKPMSFPLLISSMTGGAHDLVRRINRNLALAAEHCGVAMGVGSQRVMFSEPEARESFRIRPFAPHALLFANLGAVQLNCGFDIDSCRAAVEVLEADALFLHLNPLQEAVQPEGDVDFSGLTARILAIAAELEVPIMLKEVGAGIGPEDVKPFLDSPVRIFDVAGSGGTSWSRIEAHRGGGATDPGMLFQDWGIPTPLALELLQPYADQITLIASGGIRSGLDMAKAVILGARLCGLAAPFLGPATESAEAVVAGIERLRREFTTAMFLLGVSTVEALCGNRELILRDG
jgi:isopentenyl-diphosphate delta-isomerase